MNKINWKIRFTNPVFIFQLVIAVFSPILVYFGMTPESLTSWPVLLDTVVKAISNPYVWILVIISVAGVINDPTVKGISDSKQALTYEKTKENK